MRRACELVFRLLFLLDGGVWSLRNLSISVPRGALAGDGRAAVLRCQYELEGAPLYSIRWYRANIEFYRFVPRELPPYMVFPLPGASVDLAQSDQQQVRIVNLHRRLSGEYQCEVTADAPLFHTDIRKAPLTVVDPPFRAPRLVLSRVSYARGDVIRANCSVDEAYPAPNITWIMDEQKIAESVSPPTPELDFRERAASSQLEVTVHGAQYKAALTSGGLTTDEQFQYYGDGETDDRKDKVIRYSMPPPPSGQFSLRCITLIYDVYERSSEPQLVREDAPRPASVTGDDSAGAVVACSGALAGLCACAALLAPRRAL